MKLLILFLITFSLQQSLFDGFSNYFNDTPKKDTQEKQTTTVKKEDQKNQGFFGSLFGDTFNKVIDKFNPFTPNLNGTPLAQCDKQYNLKNIFSFIPVDELLCKPIHAEFGRSKDNSYGAQSQWLFQCTYTDPILKKDHLMYLRVDAVMTTSKIATGNFNEIKSEDGVSWLMGSNKRFLQNGLLDENSLRCEQTQRILYLLEQ